MKNRRARAWRLWSTCAMLPVLVARVLHGQPTTPTQWSLTTADFRTQVVAFEGIDESGVRVSSSGGTAAVTTRPAAVAPGERQSTTVSFDRFLSIERAGLNPSGALSGRLVIELTDGDRFAGEPVATTGEVLAWNSRSLGKIQVPFRSIASIGRADPAGRALLGGGDELEASDDLILLANGDNLRGVVTEITAAAVIVQGPGVADPTPVAWSAIELVRFASVSASGAGAGTGAPGARQGSAGAAARPFFRVTLTDGSVVSVDRPALGLDRQLRLPARRGRVNEPPNAAVTGERAIPLDAVASIEQVDGPVVWLSSLVPSEQVHTAFLDDVSWPARFDLAVDGSPLRAGDAIYSHGIGVHAYSRLSFSIDSSLRAFRTKFAIAPASGTTGEAPYADVTVRIRLDGKTVFEKAGVRANTSELPEFVQLETGGATTLTLEVDFGDNLDVQDRFNWIEPALLRLIPEASRPTAPATQP